MLLLFYEGGNGGGSTVAATKILVQPVPPSGIAANRFFNGVGPHAPDLRELGDYLNALCARRGRVLFTKYVTTRYSTANSTDTSTLRFACHTGPLAERVRVVSVGYPPTSRATSDSYGYWVLTTGLTGSGDSTTGSSIFASGTTSATEADYFFTHTQEFDVEPDTHYRFQFHQVNAFGLSSVTVYEVQRAILDSAADSPVVNVTKIAQNAGIYGGASPPGTVYEMHRVLDKLWRRGGHPLLYWSRDGSSALATTATTAANILDETTTPAAATLGWPVKVSYSGSLDSANVGVVFWVNAYVSNAAATGTITLRDQANNIIATVSVTATTATWYSTTGNLTDASGGTPTTRLEVYAAVTATFTLNVHAFGCFMYTA